MKQADNLVSLHIPKILVVSDQTDTAPAWGFILRQQGLTVAIENRIEKAIDRWAIEIPDLVVIDIDISCTDPIELCREFRTVCTIPILLFLPVHHETQILDAYAVGVDDVIVKPIGPAIFLAKTRVWVRRGWTVHVDELSLVTVGKNRLDPTRRCFIKPDGLEIKLTNLEFRLMHLLMGRPGYVFSAENIIQTIWGNYGNGDQVLLKNVVYRLRKKIEADFGKPVLLQTWQGGYSFHG